MRRFLTICTMAVSVLILLSATVVAQIQVTATDITPTAPLPNPSPDSHQPRYISGFGSGDSFTLFFEDRDAHSMISYVSTTTGPTGLSASAMPTNIFDTHFCVKDWPINIKGTDYAYRAWGALWNTADHHFYVSNDLENWTLASTFTIPTLGGVGGQVFYGFHDVIELNGMYYAWGECNIGYTLICRSDNGDDDWEAFACVGGLNTLSNVGPLGLPDVGTPTGSFFELGGDRGYGKIMIPGDDAAVYLAVNTAAKPSLPSAQLEAAFIDPANWTWHDGTTGLATTPILTATSEHDYSECWLVPDDDTAWIILYDADFGSADGGKALGYAIFSAPLPCTPVSIESLIAEPLIVPLGNAVDFEAGIVGDCGQIDALWDFDDETMESQTDVTGPVISSTHTYSSAGVYTAVLTLSDDIVDYVDGIVVVVYDPDGSFVTGGGWIYSEPGAYRPDTELKGKANFGFVSKYKKGASVPDGQTEFIFQTAGLNFHSDSYEWLVVAGAKAMFKGMGTVNGTGNYGFMLSAIDAAQTPNTDVDLFRIKIWDKDNGDAVVYDNQLGGAEDADPTIAIGGGSIIVHTSKKK